MRRSHFRMRIAAAQSAFRSTRVRIMGFQQLQSKRPEGLLDSNQKSMGIYAYLSIAHTNTERQSFATSLKAFRLLTEQGIATSNTL